MTARILVIDDEPAMLEACEETLTYHGYRVQSCGRAADGIECFGQGGIDLVLLDLKMPDMDGLQALRALQGLDRTALKVMITAFPTISTAVEAVKEGAFDYLPKPFTPDQLLIVVERALGQKRLTEENARLKRALGLRDGYEGIVARSPQMMRILELVERVAGSDSSVVIEGETGTGKELVARCLHANSRRRDGPFLAIDCGALPQNLLESELFGHERGAFTGADRRRPGLLESAQGGTVFLDEIANLSLDLQVKLLRVLQERRVRRLGGREDFEVDFRLISAANQSLDAAMKAGRFRQDLFYRLNVVTLSLPPLRERVGDVPLLAERFVETLNETAPQPVTGLTQAAVDVLEAYRWPGNVRELHNALEGAHSLCRGEYIDAADLPARIRDHAGAAAPAVDGAGLDLEQARLGFERRYLQSLLERCSGNVSRAARAAGLHRSSLQRLLRRHGLEAADWR